ncbi:unnamed protein product, partial [Closterium sp. NIES-64]
EPSSSNSFLRRPPLLPSPACGSPSSGRGEKLLLGGADLCALMRADGGKSGLAGGGGKGAGEESKGGRRGAVGSSEATVEKRGKRGDASDRGGHGGEQKKGRGGSGDQKGHETTMRRKGGEEEGEDMQAKKFQEAINLFNQVEAEGGELSDQLFIGRGLCHLMLKRFDEAEDDFTEGIQRFPRSAELYRRRAMLYIERNERETAVEDLSRSLEIEPDNQDALQHRGIIAFHIHLYGMAIADLSRALDMRPMDAYLIRAKGIALAGAGQWRNASAVFAEAVKQLVMPGLLGIALAGAGQWRNASAVFAEAVRRHPMSAHLWTEKGRVHKELGEVDLALAALHKALALEDTLEAYIRLTSSCSSWAAT